MMIPLHVWLRRAMLPLSVILSLAAQSIPAWAAQEPAPQQAKVQAQQLRRLQQEAQLRMLQPGLNQVLRAGDPITEAFLNQYLFGRNGSEEIAHNRLSSQIDREIADISQACRLTPAQKNQAELAGRGDITRFFNQFEEFRQRFQGMPYSADSLMDIRQKARMLQTKLNITWIGERSLLHKSLLSHLGADQISRLEAWKNSRKREIHLAAVHRIIQQLRTSPNPISHVKQNEIISFLLRETQPPPVSMATYDIYFLLLQIDRLDKNKLTTIFDAANLAILDQFIEAARNVEPTLRSLGYFQDEDDAGVAAVTAGK